MDLRYNEMWEAWDSTTAEDDGGGYSSPLFKRDLVLSWKQLNVTVRKKIPKLFGTSEVVDEHILKNGKDGPAAAAAATLRADY